MLNYKKYSDYDLLTLFNTNDERVLIEIYDRYWDKMLAVAFNRLGNLQEAEECVQDVLCKLWKLRSTFSLQNEKLSSYLARAVRNQTFNIIYQNKQKRQKLAGYSPQESSIPFRQSGNLSFWSSNNRLIMPSKTCRHSVSLFLL